MVAYWSVYGDFSATLYTVSPDVTYVAEVSSRSAVEKFVE
jgi:hypothetical protein